MKITSERIGEREVMVGKGIGMDGTGRDGDEMGWDGFGERTGGRERGGRTGGGDASSWRTRNEGVRTLGLLILAA